MHLQSPDDQKFLRTVQQSSSGTTFDLQASLTPMPPRCCNMAIDEALALSDLPPARWHPEELVDQDMKVMCQEERAGKQTKALSSTFCWAVGPASKADARVLPLLNVGNAPSHHPQ